MGHIGIFSPPAPGHVNPMSCLGRALQARRHRVTYFQIRDFEDAVRRTGLEYAPIGESAFPRGFTDGLYAELGRRKGPAALQYIIGWFTREALVLAEEGPTALRRAGIEMMLVDQGTPAAATIAEHLGIPFVFVSNALVLNRERGIPPFFTP